MTARREDGGNAAGRHIGTAQDRDPGPVSAPTPAFEQAFWTHDGLFSDKWVQYLPVYQEEVGRIVARSGSIRLLEIGVQNGGSLHIWSKALPQGSQIVGIDVNPRCATLSIAPNVRVLEGDATNRDTVERLLGSEMFDVIVDDGSHVSTDIIDAFFVCFPHLAPGGTYLIEDLHASYWASHGGGLGRPGSAMEFLKSLADALNADHFETRPEPGDSQALAMSALGAWIERVTFHDSIAVIHKRKSPKSKPFARAVAGVEASVAPAIDAILAVPEQRLNAVLAAQATAHALDMQMIEEVRRRRAEAEGLHDRLRTLMAEKAEEAAAIRAQLAAERDAEVAAIQVRLEQACKSLEDATRTLEARTSDLRDSEAAREFEKDAAQMAAARIVLERDAARREAARIALERDAAHSRASAIESSSFWRVTQPARRALQAAPWLRRLGRGAARLAYRGVRGRSPGVSPHSEAAHRETAVSVPASPTPGLPSDWLFDQYGGMRTIRLPPELLRSLIVPFDFDPAPARAARIGIMIHAFYPEQLPSILRYVRQIPGSPDVFITTDTDEKRLKAELALVEWPGRVEVRLTPNRGRDVAPKLYGLADVYKDYDLVLHLHTKKSLHSDIGGEWFEYLLQTLVGSPSIIRSVLKAFEAQDKLGIVYANNWPPVRGFLNWGHNYPKAQELAERMGFVLSRDEPLEFPSGSMFWARPAALKPLLDLDLQPSDFPEEAGQVDGTVAHSIERLFLRVCEHAGCSWARIANKDIFADGEAMALRVGSIGELEDVLRRHPQLLGDPALRTSVRVLEDRPETWPICMAAEFDERSRVNLLIPTFRVRSVFGGIATAYALFDRIADALGPGVERRMVLTTEDGAIDPSDLPKGWTLAHAGGASVDRSAVYLPRSRRAEASLSVRPRDVFFASAWWDAGAAYGLIDQQRGFLNAGARLRYFIQDFEPNFSAWSAPWAMAYETYCRPKDTVAMINSTFLAGHLEQSGLLFDDKHVFQPLWTQGLGEPNHESEGRENLLLVYWRPHVERNLSPIVKSALAQWLELNPQTSQHWRIIGVGQEGGDVRLTDWKSMTSMGKLTLAQYVLLLRRAKVGLSLMLSPHPSYPPLEMAAYGIRVVTNAYGSKDLSCFGDRIDSVEHLEPAAIAAALHRATSAWEAGVPASRFDLEAAFATEDDLDGLAAAVANGIRTELGIG